MTYSIRFGTYGPAHPKLRNASLYKDDGVLFVVGPWVTGGENEALVRLAQEVYRTYGTPRDSFTYSENVLAATRAKMESEALRAIIKEQAERLSELNVVDNEPDLDRARIAAQNAHQCAINEHWEAANAWSMVSGNWIDLNNQEV